MGDRAATKLLDDELLRNYILGFYGYGDFDAPLWFVGAEEGGGESADEIARRLKAWRDRGGKLLEDLKAFHEAAGIAFSNRLQPTWKPLMVAAFAAQGKAFTDAALLEYQQESLGTFGGDTCLIERLPLPKRADKDWPYAEWSSMAELRTRRVYQRAFESARVARILDFIRDRQPRAVVFYGNRRRWLKRLPSPTERGDGFEIGVLGRTRWYATNHAMAWSNDGASRFERIGADVREHAQAARG